MPSPAGPGILMALYHVVLKCTTSTTYQISNYKSIDFKFREGDYVAEDTNPPCQVWFGSCQWWWFQLVWNIQFKGFFLFFACSGSYSVETSGPILAHDSSEDAVWYKEVPFKYVFFFIFTFYRSFGRKTQNINLWLTFRKNDLPEE